MRLLSLAVLFEMVGASFVLVLTLMAILWVFYYFNRNLGIIDLGWPLGFILTVWAYFLIGDGLFLRGLMFGAMVTIWGIRLAIYIFDRYRRQQEDPRYQKIRKNWGEENSDFKLLLMFLFQGLLVVILSIPFIIVNRNDSTQWHSLEFWGVLVWFIGLIGETFADNQLEAFKKDPANAGKVCENGLWYFSRHPNYFFEFIVWVGYFLFALASPWGILAIISPVIVLLLLTNVSGIPLTEAHSIETKGDAYREYQRTTSSFIPWFRKR